MIRYKFHAISSKWAKNILTFCPGSYELLQKCCYKIADCFAAAKKSLSKFPDNFLNKMSKSFALGVVSK